MEGGVKARLYNFFQYKKAAIVSCSNIVIHEDVEDFVSLVNNEIITVSYKDTLASIEHNLGSIKHSILKSEDSKDILINRHYYLVPPSLINILLQILSEYPKYGVLSFDINGNIYTVKEAKSLKRGYMNHNALALIRKIYKTAGDELASAYQRKELIQIKEQKYKKSSQNSFAEQLIGTSHDIKSCNAKLARAKDEMANILQDSKDKLAKKIKINSLAITYEIIEGIDSLCIDLNPCSLSKHTYKSKLRFLSYNIVIKSELQRDDVEEIAKAYVEILNNKII